MNRLLITSMLVFSGSIFALEKNNEGGKESKHINELGTEVKSCTFNEKVDQAYKITDSAGRDKYKQVKALLDSVSAAELNCNPELYGRSRSLLAVAVGRGDLEIVEFLLKKGADPLGYHQFPFEDLYYKSTDTFADYIRKQETPLRLAYGYKAGWKNTKDRQPNDESEGQKIWNLVSEAAFKTYKNELEEYCREIFKSLFQEIQKAHTEAQNADKKLMILIGEGHGEISSLLIELMAYQIGHKYLKINTVLEEMDQPMLDSYQQFGYTPTRKDRWTTVVEFLNTIAESEPNIIPIDINQYKYRSRPEKDPGDVKERNDTMAEQAIKVNENVLCIVGEAHLEGLLNDTDLIEKFHVLPIATSDGLKPGTKTSKEVKYFVELKNYEMFFAPTIVKYMYSKFSSWIKDLQ